MTHAKLYLILDTQVCHYDRLFEILNLSVRSGVDVVQLRDKCGSAKIMIRFSNKIVRYLKGKIPFIINDRVDVAKACAADGVHLGQDDLPIDVARKILGRKAIIGISCQSVRHALEAQQVGADYIGFGSVFKTLTKPDRHPMDLRILAQVHQKVSIPVFAIGGIQLEKISLLQDYGVKRVAVTRAISMADDIAEATRGFCKILNS